MKRGSTASSNVSESCAGGLLTLRTRRRRGTHQVRVRPRRGRAARRTTAPAATATDQAPGGDHATGAALPRVPRCRRPSAAAARTSATIVSVDVPPPAERRERFDRRRRSVGALGPRPLDDLAVRIGLPDEERVRLRRVRAGVETEDRVLVGRRLAAGPGHLLNRLSSRPTRSTEPASSTAPAQARTSRSRTPAGTVSSIFEVVWPSSSVGTDNVNCCSAFAFATAGLTMAWAEADATTTSAAATVNVTMTLRLIMCLLLYAPAGSVDPQSKGGGQDVSVHLGLEEEPPDTRHGHEDTDGQPAGCRRRACDLRPSEHARTADRTRATDVRVEVVERPGAEEDGVRQSSIPRCKAGRTPLWIRDRDGQERRLDRVQLRVPYQGEAVAVDGDGRWNDSAVLGRGPPFTRIHVNIWKFRWELGPESFGYTSTTTR